MSGALFLATWLVVSPGGDRASVAWDSPDQAVHVDARAGMVTGRGRLPAGERYRLDRFRGTIHFLGEKPTTLRLCREPVASALTPDGRYIYVACLLPEQSALDAHVAARVVVVDAAARRFLEERGLSERFVHSLGHGVGLETHERPTLSPRSLDTLDPGTVFTLEPGVYLPGQMGVRIEEMVLMTGRGPEVLTCDIARTAGL